MLLDAKLKAGIAKQDRDPNTENPQTAEFSLMNGPGFLDSFCEREYAGLATKDGVIKNHCGTVQIGETTFSLTILAV